jgi:hypothetical protein
MQRIDIAPEHGNFAVRIALHLVIFWMSSPLEEDAEDGTPNKDTLGKELTSDHGS